MQFFPVIAWLASVFTFVYSMILVFKTFGGKLQQAKLDKTPHEAPPGLLLSPVILISLAVVFAFFPDLVSVPLIEPAMASIQGCWHQRQPSGYPFISGMAGLQRYS
ncbi:Na(+)/H(+) antiporter subunit A [compost metagenome]